MRVDMNKVWHEQENHLNKTFQTPDLHFRESAVGRNPEN